MSQFRVPKCNILKQQQRQDQTQVGEERDRVSSFHVHMNQQQLQNLTPLKNIIGPMFSNHEVAELTWQNGQLAMHGLGGLYHDPGPTTKPTCSSSRPTVSSDTETLESLIHQATTLNNKPGLNFSTNIHTHQIPTESSSDDKRSSAPSASNGDVLTPSLFMAKCSSTNQSSQLSTRNLSSSNNTEARTYNLQQNVLDHSACGSASASASFWMDKKEKDANNISCDTSATMTWTNSFDSPTTNLKIKSSIDEDSACHNNTITKSEEREIKMETVKSNSSRRSRIAAVHNQSERRRRERINQKLKELQKLVPNASKTDKASMLEEVINYMKQLEAQVQIMRDMSQMVMLPLNMPQQHYVSLPINLARTGMGAADLRMGGMFGANTTICSNTNATSSNSQPSVLSMAYGTPSLFPGLVVPSMIPTHGQDQAIKSNIGESVVNDSIPMNDPYNTFLAQSMKMGLYNKMAAAMLYQQQLNQATSPATCTRVSSQSTHVQGD